MKKSSIILSVIIIVSIFGACSNDKPGNTVKFDLYFSNAAMDSLVTESSYINTSERENTVGFVRQVMKRLLDGPSIEGYVSVIPDSTYLKGVSLSKTEEGTVNIDLSKHYYSKRKSDEPASAELLARYSIVSTLCQFDEIKKVKIYVDGKSLHYTSGQDEAMPPLGLANVMINSPSSVETQTEKFVTLYFADKSGARLHPETRKATMTDNSLEKTVVSELIRGPVSNEYQRTIPSGAQLISVETTEGVCFVNFSGGFSFKSEEEKFVEKAAVYSVVNSLTRLPNIEKVQILIDGKKPENDTLQLYSTPLERNEEMIESAK